MEIILAELPLVKVIDGYHARFVHTSYTTMAFWEVEAGARMPMHQHLHEQTSQVMEGSFELVVGDTIHKLRPGTVIVIPSNVPHGGLRLPPVNCWIFFLPCGKIIKDNDYENFTKRANGVGRRCQ